MARWCMRNRKANVFSQAWMRRAATGRVAWISWEEDCTLC